MSAPAQAGKKPSFIINAADGSVLLEVTAIEFRPEDIVMKGKMMGAMPTVAHVTPAEVRKALRILPKGAFRQILGFGWRVLRIKVAK